MAKKNADIINERPLKPERFLSFIPLKKIVPHKYFIFRGDYSSSKYTDF